MHVAVTFVGQERGGVSGCLSRGFVGSSSALRPRSRHFRVCLLWTASVEPTDMHPTVFLTPEPSTAVFRVCCGTMISRSSRRSCLTVCLLVSLHQRLRISVSVGPFRAARNHNPTRTAIIFICVDSFIQALTAKHGMPNPSPTTRSYAHVPHLIVLVIASAAWYSGWLFQQERLSNPGGLRWSPHLMPIYHISH